MVRSITSTRDLPYPDLHYPHNVWSRGHRVCFYAAINHRKPMRLYYSIQLTECLLRTADVLSILPRALDIDFQR